jgi:hypothetical protein
MGKRYFPFIDAGGATRLYKPNSIQLKRINAEAYQLSTTLLPAIMAAGIQSCIYTFSYSSTLLLAERQPC